MAHDIVSRISVDPLVGKCVKAVRAMTKEELAAEGWTANRHHGAPAVIEFHDGTKIYPSRDSEGNGPGVMFGRRADGESFLIVGG